MLREKELKATSGLFVLLTGLAVMIMSIVGFVAAAGSERAPLAIASALVLFVTIVAMIGLFTVSPNEAKVLTLFGRYIGTVRDAETAGRPLDLSQLIRDVWLRTVSRPPAETEVARAEQHLATADSLADGLQDLLWALINTTEYGLNH